MVAQEIQSLLSVHERLRQAPELAQLRIKAFDQLQTYWKAFYQTIYYNHLGYISLVAALMTEDVARTGSHISGPIPLFFPVTQSLKTNWGLADYRELNDHRVAIVSPESGVINEPSLGVMMELDTLRLTTLDESLGFLMESFSKGITYQEEAGCTAEIQANSLWQKKGFFEFNPDTLGIALEGLGQKFQVLKRK